ncbi:hypothetical protein G3M80_03410 [Bacillus altitudinis]|uniref:hypothetical protein n=1 Tax=Bacillus altitudinis TaxID=293387 RepID=UPI0013EE8B70|nr:hypothetical protein [Bacillus altitudinis]QII23662.1 hypothetical protein G3M80_03410 [Bacillus altitudinis]
MKAKKVVISLGLAGALIGVSIWGLSAANAKQETQDKEQPKTAIVKETKAETKEKVKKEIKEVKEVKKAKPKKVKKFVKQQKQVVSEQPQQKERIVASGETKKADNSRVSKAPVVKKEQSKVYRNTTGSSSPSKKHVQPKKKYVSNGNGGSNQSKSSAPKKSTAVPKKTPANNSTSNGKKTGQGKIENHAGSGESTYSYDKHTYSEKDLDVPWDELNK